MPARFYLPSTEWASSHLSEEEAHHALRVLRVKEGDKIELFDGEGRVASAAVSKIQGKSLHYEVLEEQEYAREHPSLHLYQAIPKGKNMDWIIQKAVELGVSSIHPLYTQNTVAVSDQPRKKTDKWKKTALEACKQCKQPFLPVVHPPAPLTDSFPFLGEVKIMGALCAKAVPLRQILTAYPSPPSVSIAIGPEGDFTTPELMALEEQGFLPASLGKLILRVETAALFLLSAVRYQYAEGP